MGESIYPDFQSLRFVFKEQDFYPDIQTGADSAKEEWDWHNEQDRFRALYQLGFEEKKANITVTANYLYNLVFRMSSEMVRNSGSRNWIMRN